VNLHFDTTAHFSGLDQVTGFDGAAEIAQILQQQGVKFEFVHDEGSTVLKDVIPGLRQPLAM